MLGWLLRRLSFVQFEYVLKNEPQICPTHLNGVSRRVKLLSTECMCDDVHGSCTLVADSAHRVAGCKSTHGVDSAQTYHTCQGL